MNRFLEILPVFLFGTLWGSFFYTLALRFSDGSVKENPVKALFSSSCCEKCGTKINPVYLVPIIGFILQRGRCAMCGERISAWYPISEIGYGFLASLIYADRGAGIYSLCVFLIIAASACVSIIDAKTQTVPDSLVISIAALTVYPVISAGSPGDSALGFLLMFAFFAVILFIFPGSFGAGDLKFASVIGFFLGFEFSLVALEASLISGAVFGAAYAVGSGRGFKIKIAFAPFLTIGLITAVMYGREILLLYYKIAF